MSKSRKFVFTLNNPSDASFELLGNLDCKYIIYGKEIAPTTGTRHLQGFVYFGNPRTISGVRRVLTGCHVESARGSFEQCITYCKKDGDYTERGEAPVDRGTIEKERWQTAWDLAKQGDLEGIDADIRIRSYSTLKRIARDFQATVETMDRTAGIWIYGTAGSGKTKAVFESYPELYPKGLNKWWCGYQGEEVILLDDVDPSHQWLRAFLKVWGDRYPFIGEEKGGSRKIRPKKFIVTSQYTIEQMFEDTETREALTRRFIVIEKTHNQNIII